jgi:hypothetical protein
VLEYEVLGQCLSKCGPRPFARWSASSFGRKQALQMYQALNEKKIHTYMSVLKPPLLRLTTDIMFLLFTCMHFWVWKILQKMDGPHVRRPSVKWCTIAELLRNVLADYGWFSSVGWQIEKGVCWPLHSKIKESKGSNVSEKSWFLESALHVSRDNALVQCLVHTHYKRIVERPLTFESTL